jgi:hypothetical protein
MEQKKGKSDLTHSYKALRQAVGWIGMLLPLVLMFGVFFLFDGNLMEKSISSYYYTGMRDVLVGALCAIGLFLFFYSGYDRWDDWAGNIAGFTAICVAWFPGTKEGTGNWVSTVHFISATIFFLTLAGYSLFLFTKKGQEVSSQKRHRNVIYIICGIVMVGCLAGLIIYYLLPHAGKKSVFVFVVESVALIAFGLSWLTKGGALFPDK